MCVCVSHCAYFSPRSSPFTRHHCEAEEAFGFCVYSNVSVAVRALQQDRPDIRVMVVDWDVHHGNSTQHQVWHDDHVLYTSIHRYDERTFFPGAVCADLDRVGENGTNINIPFSTKGEVCGDAEYMAAFDHVLLPAARAFRPDLIIVSCGFDSVRRGEKKKREEEGRRGKKREEEGRIG